MEPLERDLPLMQLEEHLRLAAAGQGRVVFLAGETGVGKTTLANVFCQGAAGQATELKISCDALSTPWPLGPLCDLAPALDIHPDRYPGDRDGRDQLFRDVLGSLARGRKPTVVMAEDAHWADGATLDLLHFLSRRLGEQRVLFIVTYRDDEIGSDHPLRLLLGDLATAPAVSRMRLLPLSEEAVRHLAEGSSRDPSALYRLTGGNPFFLTEVLASEEGSVPATVGDAVLARASRLPPVARAVLDLAAVIGTEIALDILGRVTGPAFDAVDACIARGLLQGTGDAIAFRHAMARDAILAAMAPPRRRPLHVQVLAALRDAPEAARDLALLAHHAEAAGDREAVLAFATAAAERPLHVFLIAKRRPSTSEHCASPPRPLQPRALTCSPGDRWPATSATRARPPSGHGARHSTSRVSWGRNSRKARVSAGCRTSTGSQGGERSRKLPHVRRWRCSRRSRRVQSWPWPTAIWPSCACSPMTWMGRCTGVSAQSRLLRRWVKPKSSSMPSPMLARRACMPATTSGYRT